MISGEMAAGRCEDEAGEGSLPFRIPFGGVITLGSAGDCCRDRLTGSVTVMLCG